MPLYFFHLRDGDDILLDPEGRNLETLNEIRTAALAEARGILSQEALAGRIELGQQIDVMDADKHLIYTIRFADAVEIVCGNLS